MFDSMVDWYWILKKWYKLKCYIEYVWIVCFLLLYFYLCYMNNWLMEKNVNLKSMMFFLVFDRGYEGSIFWGNNLKL